MPDNSTETYKLTGLELDRVDLVTAGANPGAHVLIAKAADPVDKGRVSINITVEDDDEFRGPEEVGRDSFGNPLPILNDTVNVVMQKFDADATLSDKTAETPDVQPQEVDKTMADVKDETVAKADFEALQNQLAEQIAKAEEVEAARLAEIEKAASLEERIEKMEQERRQAEYVAKARDYSNLGKADELGPLLLAANDHFSEDQYKMLERLLKAANAQVEKGALFAQFSKTDGDEPDVMDRINSLAKAKVDAGEAKTIQLAKQMVIRENPALRDEYVAARSAL